MKEVSSAKIEDSIKYYHVASYEGGQFRDGLSDLVMRNYDRKMAKLNNKSIKFKHTKIEDELIMFLEDILIKKDMSMFSSPDEMHARILRFCEEFDAGQVREFMLIKSGGNSTQSIRLFKHNK